MATTVLAEATQHDLIQESQWTSWTGHENEERLMINGRARKTRGKQGKSEENVGKPIEKLGKPLENLQKPMESVETNGRKIGKTKENQWEKQAKWEENVSKPKNKIIIRKQ